MASQAKRSRNRTEFARALTEAGFTDFLMLDTETAQSVLTERRVELLRRIRAEDFDSVQRLADDLGRDKAAVSRDLGLLFEHNAVDYEVEGSRKVPTLKHERIVVEPIL